MADQVINWLRTACSTYKLEPVAIYRSALTPAWPLVANSEAELREKLDRAGHFLPLPKEPAALANVLEVSIVDFIASLVENTAGAEVRRGTERGYPDIELHGPFFGGGFHAVDVKVARRAKNGKRTKSRITLYTGNTYFRHPKLKWAGTFRPFQEYISHLDIIALYTFNEKSASRVEDVELLVMEPWRIASKKRSSTTREYLGAVDSIDDLRNGVGEFKTEAEFYTYWRKFPFKVGQAVQQQLDKLLNLP